MNYTKNYNGEHSLDQMLENENIKPDRFGLAAISYIFKAFGDVIRSKEYWPWGDSVNFSWDNGKDNITQDKMLNALDRDNDPENDWKTSGNASDLTRALLCLKEAQIRSQKEVTVEIKTNNKNSIKALKKRLDQFVLRNKKSNLITSSINSTSQSAKEEKSMITDV